METTIKDKAVQGIMDAISSRGKNKGILKAKCPKMNTPGSAAWQAIMGLANPYKVGFGHLFFMDKETREIYNYILKMIEDRNVDCSKMDRDRNALEQVLIW